MTAPIRPIPTVPRGNLALDIAGAGAGLISGLKQEQERQRQAALDQALMQIRQLQAQAALTNALKPTPGQIVATPTPTGMGFALASRETPTAQPVTMAGQPLAAPESQFILPTEFTEGPQAGQLGAVGVSRQRPGVPATQIPFPSGQQPRDISPAVQAVETAQGPQVMRVPRRGGEATPVVGPGGAPIQPKAQQFEVEKAQFAANMSRAADVMDQVAEANPQAVNDVVTRLTIQGVLQSLPVIGAPAGEVARAAAALGLSDDAANYLASFYTFLGFAVPELAGKQMTIQEMRQQMAMFVPLPGEPESARRLKRENVQFRVESAFRASGPGAQRVGRPEPSTQPPPKNFDRFLTPRP